MSIKIIHIVEPQWGVSRGVAGGLLYEAYAIPSRPVRSSVPTGVGTLVTHGKGGIPSLYQDGFAIGRGDRFVLFSGETERLAGH